LTLPGIKDFCVCYNFALNCLPLFALMDNNLTVFYAQLLTLHYECHICTNKLAWIQKTHKDEMFLMFCSTSKTKLYLKTSSHAYCLQWVKYAWRTFMFLTIPVFERKLDNISIWSLIMKLLTPKSRSNAKRDA